MGYDATGTYGFLNDLWEFNAALKQWEWVGGSNSIPCFECGVPGSMENFKCQQRETYREGARMPHGGRMQKGISGCLEGLRGMPETSSAT
jgi:hypothetical protein